MKKAQIKDFPNYIITDTGDVYSCNYHRSGKIRVINQYLRGKYLCVRLYKNKIPYNKPVHRLVAEAFIPNPEHKEQVNHIDGNKLNNKISNLEWNTRSENMKHAYRVLKMRPNKPWLNKFGKDNCHSRIVLQIQDGEIIAEFYGAAEASRRTGISRTAILNCCYGWSNTAGGYKWKRKKGDIN